MTTLDAQITEVLGRNRLVDELIRARLEVALPVRDRGVDLVAYIDLRSDTERFIARPIQLKASSAASWGLDRKYERISGLLIAYVWYVAEPRQAVTYALTYAEAEAIIAEMGYARTSSWTEKGLYAVTSPGDRLVKLLAPHKMDAERWRAKVVGSR